MVSTTALVTDHDYDAIGRLLSVEETENGQTATTTYSYDTYNRPISYTKGSEVTTIEWDGLSGRRLHEGPPTSPHNVSYQYSSEGWLTGYANAAQAVEASFGYSDAYRSSSVLTQGEESTSFSYSYHQGKLLAVAAEGTSEDWSIAYLYNESDRPYAGVYTSPTTGSIPFFMVLTDRGDVVEMLDADGYAFGAYRYDAWGAPLSVLSRPSPLFGGTEGEQSLVAQQITERQVLRYAALCYDSSLDLYVIGRSYYDPRSRFYVTGAATDAPYQTSNPVWGIDGVISVEQSMDVGEDTAPPSLVPVSTEILGSVSNPFPEPRRIYGRFLNTYPAWTGPWYWAHSNYDQKAKYWDATVDWATSVIISCKARMNKSNAFAALKKVGYWIPGTTMYMWVSNYDGCYGYNNNRGLKDPCFGQWDSYAHVRLYAPWCKYYEQEMFYRPRTLDHSSLCWVVGTTHYDVNEYQYGYYDDAPLPAYLPVLYSKYGKYYGNSEAAERRLRAKWSALSSLDDGFRVVSVDKIRGNNRNYGGLSNWKSGFDGYYYSDFCWWTSNGYITELRVATNWREVL